MLHKLRCWISERKKHRALKRIRAEMAFWGCDINDLTDAEIEEGVVAMSKALSQVGISAKQAASRITRAVQLAKGK